VTWPVVARAQDGVISRAQLRSAGLSDDSVDRLVWSGTLVRLSPGVFLAGAAPMTFRARLWAAVLATDGVLGLATAGQLWGVVDDRMLASCTDDVHIMLPHRRRVEAPSGVVVHRRIRPPDGTEVRSLPTTGRRQTVLDLMATLPANEAFRLSDRAVQCGWIVPDDVRRRLVTEPRRPGNRQLRRLAVSLGDGAAAQSERVLHRLLRSAGLTGWHPNYELWSDGELVAVIDVAIPARRIAIEVDGMAYHVDVDRFRRDRTRQNTLVALGWTVLRFTWADLVERPGYVVATVRRLAAA
jgi:very-short-patch-repair endonuclease